MMRLRRLAIPLLVCLLWVAPAASPPLPAMATAVSCPTSPLTVGELRALWGGKVLGFMGYVNPGGRRCYGSADIRVVGYVGDPGATGYEEPFSVKPGWLMDPGLFLFESTATWDDRTGAAPFYVLQWPGEYLGLQRHYLHSWVSVTAHFDDLRARTCTAWDPRGMVRSQAALRRMCRSLLVIRSVTRIAGPDTATSGNPLATIDTDPAGAPWVLLLAVAVIGGWVGWRRAPARSCRVGRPASGAPPNP